MRRHAAAVLLAALVAGCGPTGLEEEVIGEAGGYVVSVFERDDLICAGFREPEGTPGAFSTGCTPAPPDGLAEVTTTTLLPYDAELYLTILVLGAPDGATRMQAREGKEVIAEAPVVEAADGRWAILELYTHSVSVVDLVALGRAGVIERIDGYAVPVPETALPRRVTAQPGR